MDIKTYILNNYNKIKNILKNEYYKMNLSSDFDEDIFHDTILKCIYSLEDKDIDEGIINYLITSFKTNCIRETLYSRNKYKTEIEDINNIDNLLEEINSKADIEKIIKLLKENFGLKYTLCFILWCKGWTINEIQNHYGIYNLYYQFKLIKKFIKRYCI